MAQPYEGDSNSTGLPGLKGTNSAPGNAQGVVGISVNGEGVHGATQSGNAAGVAGFNTGPATPGKNPSGVFGSSQNGEGVHGETSHTRFAAVAGLQLNSDPGATGAGVFGQSAGSGPGGVFHDQRGQWAPGWTRRCCIWYFGTYR